MKPVKVINNYVYIVYECPTSFKLTKGGEGIKYKGGTIHGVYVNHSEAMGKSLKLSYNKEGTLNTKLGYMCILKKPVQGKDRNPGVVEW
jgi:hypothetical protein